MADNDDEQAQRSSVLAFPGGEASVSDDIEDDPMFQEMGEMDDSGTVADDSGGDSDAEGEGPAAAGVVFRPDQIRVVGDVATLFRWNARDLMVEPAGEDVLSVIQGPFASMVEKQGNVAEQGMGLSAGVYSPVTDTIEPVTRYMPHVQERDILQQVVPQYARKLAKTSEHRLPKGSELIVPPDSLGDPDQLLRAAQTRRERQEPEPQSPLQPDPMSEQAPDAGDPKQKNPPPMGTELAEQVVKGAVIGSVAGMVYAAQKLFEGLNVIGTGMWNGSGLASIMGRREQTLDNPEVPYWREAWSPDKADEVSAQQDMSQQDELNTAAFAPDSVMKVTVNPKSHGVRVQSDAPAGVDTSADSTLMDLQQPVSVPNAVTMPTEVDMASGAFANAGGVTDRINAWASRNLSAQQKAQEKVNGIRQQLSEGVAELTQTAGVSTTMAPQEIKQTLDGLSQSQREKLDEHAKRLRKKAQEIGDDARQWIGSRQSSFARLDYEQREHISDELRASFDPEDKRSPLSGHKTLLEQLNDEQGNTVMDGLKNALSAVRDFFAKLKESLGIVAGYREHAQQVAQQQDLELETDHSPSMS